MRMLASALIAVAVVACGSGGADDSMEDSDTTATPAPVTAAEAESEPRELIPVTLRLDWNPVARHGAFHLALERGYFEEEGLDVRILDGIGSAAAVQLVGAGADDFGLASLGTMAAAVANEDVPVRAIAGLVQEVPDNVFSLAESGIEDLEDLEGTVWGAPPASSGTVLFPAVAAAAGIDMDTIEQVTIEPASTISSLVRGDVDWITDYYFSTTVELEEQGVDYNTIPFSDYITVHGNGLIASNDLIENSPEVVQAFVTASVRGITDLIEEPEAAVDALLAARPVLAGERDRILAVIDRMRPYMLTDRTEGHPVGWMSPEDWQESADIFTEYMDASSVDPELLYTNQFTEQE